VSAGNQRADSRLTRIDHPEPAGAGRAVLTPPFRLDGARTPPGSAGDFARADGRVRETRDMEITIETPSHPFMNHGQRHSHLLTGLGNGYDWNRIFRAMCARGWLKTTAAYRCSKAA